MALLLLLVFVRFCVFGFYDIGSNSMKPALDKFDRIITLRTGWYSSLPARYSIVTYIAPDKPEKVYIKRLIGLPGEKVQIENGYIKINGQPFDKLQEEENNIFMAPISLAEDEFFVLADDRLNSLDSRTHGPVKVNALAGEVIFRYWPFGKLGMVD